MLLDRSLWLARDNHFFLRLQPRSVDRVGGRHFSDRVDVEVVTGWRQVLAKREFNALGVLFQSKMLVADGGCPPDFVHGKHDDGEVEIVIGVVGDEDGAFNSLVNDFGIAAPHRHERRDHGHGVLVTALVGRFAAVVNSCREGERPRFGWRADELTVILKNEPCREPSFRDFPT